MTLDLLIVGPAGKSTGGIARYIAAQREHLRDHDVRMRVHDTSTPSGRGPREIVANGAVSTWDVARFPLRPRPDVVHVHSSHQLSFYRAACYVLYAAHVWTCPIVLHVHGSSFDEFVRTANPAVRRLQSAAFEASDAIVVLSDYWKRVLAERTSEDKLVVLPNAVNADEYAPAFDADLPTVAFVSNHIRRKGIVELVEAVDRLKYEGAPPFRVRIAGAGPESGRARELAERYDDVDYLGYVSEAEKRRLIDAATIYALPTYAEGLPIALLEGMAGGNAVVTTTVGSIPEVVGADNGHLVEPGDGDALTAALRDLIERPEAVAEMGRTNRRLIRRRYSWSETADRLLELYRDLAAEPAVERPAVAKP